MKSKAVLTHRVYPETLALLQTVAEVVPNQTDDTLPPAELLQRTRDAHAVMAFMPDSVDSAFLEACPQLKIVAAALKGYDNFDVAACTERKVWLSIVPNMLTIPTAELTVGLLLGLTRHITAGDTHIRSGNFRGWRASLYGEGLTGKTVGIIGMGRVGKAIAKRLSGFDVNILYSDTVALDAVAEAAWSARPAPLEQLLAKSDIVIPMLPLTSETLHLIDAGAIARMKRGAYLVNTGRGSVVDEAAVVAALYSGQLAGYAADVFEMEDWLRSDRPVAIPQALLENPTQTLFTPHLGSATRESRIEIERQAAQDIIRVLRGQAPLGAVNRLGEAMTV